MRQQDSPCRSIEIRSRRRAARGAIYLLFLLSGASGLIYEVVWLRMLTITLGNTVHAASLVLSVFMTGLALGSYVGGRIGDRRQDPLRIYGLLEVAIGISGLGVTLALGQTSAGYVGIHRALADHPLLLGSARYVFSFVLLVVPTALMGATLPILSRFVVDRQPVVGLGLGSLYAVNTLGAAAGCFLAGFVLVGNVGVGPSVRIAAVLNIVAGAAVLALARRAATARSGLSSAAADAGAPGGVGVLVRRLVLISLAASGFAALGYEVIWTRVLVSYLGNSVYAFTTVTMTFLVGIALGSLAAAAVADRLKRPATILGLVQLGIGLYVLLFLHLVGRYPEVFAALRQPSPTWGDTGARFLKAFGLMLVPTFLMGSAFPIAARIYVAGLRRLGRNVGELYAWNTAGAIVGAAAAGFVLMPVVGLQGSLVFLLGLNSAVGIALCAAEPGLRRSTRWLLPGAIAAVAAAGLMGLPDDAFRSMHELQTPDGKLVFYREDLVGTVTVRQRDDEVTLLIDDLDVAGTGAGFLSSHKSLGHLPMLLHPRPESVYVLGFGGGGTTYATGTYPTVRRIDATELSRSVVEVAEMFVAINHGITSDPRLNLDVNDGRHFLLTTTRAYDVLSVDLLWPQTAGAGSLYTKEFYELCFRALDDDGIMVQWLHPGFIPTLHVQTILRTVRQAFPHASLWWARRHEHLILVASKRPLRIDMASLSRRMRIATVWEDLAEVHLNDPAAFVSYFIAADQALDEFASASGWLNTDELPLLEYELPLWRRRAGIENLEAMAQLEQSVLPWTVNATADQRQRIRVCEQSNRSLDRGIIAWFSGRLDAARGELRRALEVNPENHDAQEILHMLTEEGSNSSDP